LYTAANSLVVSTTDLAVFTQLVTNRKYGKTAPTKKNRIQRKISLDPRLTDAMFSYGIYEKNDKKIK
ncbi:MAG: hypothetical protein ACHQYO_02085, partial [Halanaerobiales bacterium]